MDRGRNEEITQNEDLSNEANLDSIDVGVMIVRFHFERDVTCNLNF